MKHPAHPPAPADRRARRRPGAWRLRDVGRALGGRALVFCPLVFGLLGGGLPALVLGGCTHLTLESSAAVDFARYRHVWLAPVEGEATEAQRAALAERMRRETGFRVITLDAAERVEARLSIQVRLDGVDEDATDPEFRYTCAAAFELRDAGDDRVVDSGTVYGFAASPEAAADAALDEVSLHYLLPYRI